MDFMKQTAKPFLTLFGIALIIAVIGRIGLAIMAASGALAFDYISASGVAILDVICSILTGSAFVAFLFAAGLALCLSTAGPVLYGYLYAKGTPGAGRPLTAFLWGWATALAAIICLVVVASGILSAVQVGSMSSKLPGLPVIILGVIVFAAFLGTLLGAASMVVCACVARTQSGRGGLNSGLLAATAVCGLVVMVLTVGTFSTLNSVAINTTALLAWFAADVVVNLLLMLGASRRLSRGEVAKTPAAKAPASHRA